MMVSIQASVRGSNFENLCLFCVDGIYAYQTSFGLQANKSSIVVKGPFFPQV
jgi:hypothetical protein